MRVQSTITFWKVRTCSRPSLKSLSALHLTCPSRKTQRGVVELIAHDRACARPVWHESASVQGVISGLIERLLRAFRPVVACSTTILSLEPSAEGPSVWLALTALIGLPTALWLYKCAMMVLFQRKIIYMGYIPPGARQEQLGVDVPVPTGIRCEEIKLQSEGHVTLSAIVVRSAMPDTRARAPNIVVVYLQGNAGNPLNRIPVFEKLIKATAPAQTLGTSRSESLDLAVVAAAPRSFWKSSNRKASQHGFLADYSHVLSYTSLRFPSSTIVLYGHSLGGAVAICLAARLQSSEFPAVKGLIVENPFLSIPSMVQALYPQRWLPYRYLTPFVFDKWDAGAAIRGARERPAGSLLERLSEDMLVLTSEKDEVVPTAMAGELYDMARGVRSGEQELTAERDLPRMVVIRDALHEHAWKQQQWVAEMRRYLHGVR
ncbi:Alpha/Beta hydrolase protein [Amylocystis lapponica]|nr:Alpha/Beta hydrolase protein [Amylocystis lapponica]